MSLRAEIETICGRTILLIDEAYDFFLRSQKLWRLVQFAVRRRGLRFTITNSRSGQAESEATIAGMAQQYISDYLAPAALEQFVSIFEAFYVDVLRAWLRAHPGSLRERQVSVGQVLDAADLGAVVDVVIDKELTELTYRRISDWFDYLGRRAGVTMPAEHEVGRLAEIKASRDVLIHNRGEVNDVYIAKAGSYARHRVGESINVSLAYLRESHGLMRTIVADLSARLALNAA